MVARERRQHRIEVLWIGRLARERVRAPNACERLLAVAACERDPGAHERGVQLHARRRRVGSGTDLVRKLQCVVPVAAPVLLVEQLGVVPRDPGGVAEALRELAPLGERVERREQLTAEPEHRAEVVVGADALGRADLHRRLDAPPQVVDPAVVSRQCSRDPRRRQHRHAELAEVELVDDRERLAAEGGRGPRLAGRVAHAGQLGERVRLRVGRLREPADRLLELLEGRVSVRVSTPPVHVPEDRQALGRPLDVAGLEQRAVRLLEQLFVGMPGAVQRLCAQEEQARPLGIGVRRELERTGEVLRGSRRRRSARAPVRRPP